MFCLTENDFVFPITYTPTPPTVCPNNDQHSINNNSVALEARYTADVFRLSIEKQIDSASYETVSFFQYYGDACECDLVQIKMVAWIHEDTTSFDIRVYDSTHHNTICYANNLTNTSPEIITLSPVSNLPDGEALFEIHVKIVGEEGSAHISSCSIIKQCLAPWLENNSN
jgi:hypothetical protein